MTGWSGEEGLIRGQQNQVRTKVRVILSLVSTPSSPGSRGKAVLALEKRRGSRREKF